MSVYQNMYLELFNAITNALEQISQHNYALAESILIRAQQEAEETYIKAES